MHCPSCGTPLPPKVVACPNCGALTASYLAKPGAWPDAPTVPASSSRAQLPIAPTIPASPYHAQQYPPTELATSPFDIPIPPPPPPPDLANPYGVLPQDPYRDLIRTPSTPPVGGHGTRIGIMIAMSLLVLLLLSGGILALLPRSTLPGPAQRRSNATATANPGQNPYMSGGTLILSDPLKDNSRGYKWDEATVSNNGGIAMCGFVRGAYHVTEAPGVLQTTVCGPEGPAFFTLSNFTFEVTLTIVQGNSAGIAFRFNLPRNTGYFFRIDTQGGYRLTTIDGPTSNGRVLEEGTNGAINKGLNRPNVLAIVAEGDTLSMYVNGVLLDSPRDSAHQQGLPQIFVEQSPVDVVARDARVWKL